MHWFRKVMLVGGAVAALVAAGGCGNRGREGYPVTGQVIYRGKPLANATVTLVSLDPNAQGMRRAARSDERGRFELKTFTPQGGVPQGGAPAGSYAVAVECRKLVLQGGEWEPGNNLLPRRFADPQTSGLKVEVNKGPTELKPLEIAAR